jgi:hypothetical protein
VAASVRDRSFTPPELQTNRYLLERGIDVSVAVAAAKGRWS